VAGRRVVVTGLGVICALGRDRGEFWASLAAGRGGVGPLVGVDGAQLRIATGAQVRDFDPESCFDPRRVALLDRFAQFGLIAAREAVADAGVRWERRRGERAAVVMGSCVGGQSSQDVGFVALYRDGQTRVGPLSITRIMANAAACHVAMEFGITGPTYTVSTACASAGHAIGQAFWMVRHGVADLALAGGSEAPFSYGNLKAWEAMRVVAPDVCRPFSRDRAGMVLGEGGAVLVLEPAEAALARGARVYAEVVGFGMNSDAYHLTQPSPAGAARAMAMALEDGGIAPERVGYVNAHGTGTLANDPMETRAIREAFGAHAERLAVSSTKSMHGHALGAAGAIEAAATVLALHRGIIPPTANFTEPDPECDLDVVPNEPRPASPEFALSNSFAFGGLNAVLAFRRWDA
jgi:nodulation protein E